MEPGPDRRREIARAVQQCRRHEFAGDIKSYVPLLVSSYPVPGCYCENPVGLEFHDLIILRSRKQEASDFCRKVQRLVLLELLLFS